MNAALAMTGWWRDAMSGADGRGRGRVIVAGGSIAGLFAGVLLHRLGFAVDVFERSGEALASRGAGIVPHPELFDVLTQAGAALDDTTGVPVVGRITLNRDGSVLGAHALPQVMMSWDRLYRVVRAALPDACHHAGNAVESFDQDDEGVAVRLADGRQIPADWLIGADGIRSTVRRQLLPDLDPAYAGYVAWRGLIDESAMSADARAVLGDRLMFCLPAGEQMLGYPVPGADEALGAGRRRYNVVWYRPADEAAGLPRRLTGRDGRRHDLSVPPGQVEPGAVAGLRAAALALLAPCCAEAVLLTAEPFLQAIYDLESPRLVFGRVILIGDAAFVARPHAGMGVTKAGLDALGLAQALDAADPAAALREWERQRLRYGRAVVERARWLGAYLSEPAPAPDAWSARVAELAATLMTETAISGWLRA
jgi:2-polyprenyl-6-methoxyphenol hydroxylase-like FAD-dependent oxidoreductase